MLQDLVVPQVQMETKDKKVKKDRRVEVLQLVRLLLGQEVEDLCPLVISYVRVQR